MNKKGFTLIEVIISLALVSVVIVSMLASLVKVKEAYSIVYDNSDALVYSSTISRIINNDLAQNGGIKYVNCSLSGDSCELILGTDAKRKIEVYDVELGTNQKGKNYYYTDSNGKSVKKTVDDDTYCEKIYNCYNETRPDGSKEYVCDCNIKLVSSVLRYSDTSIDDNGKTLYIKTIKNKKLSDFDTTTGDLKKESTVGYTFGKIISTIKTYESANRFKKDKTVKIPYTNSLVHITIQLYDGIDKNDSSYNIQLYSTSSYASDSIRVGDEIVLNLDSGDELTARMEYSEIILKYGIGYFVYEDEIDKDGNPTGEKKLVSITSITSPKSIIPKGIDENGQENHRRFLGYSIINKDGIQVDIIDENGKILVSNKYFTNKMLVQKLTARWE